MKLDEFRNAIKAGRVQCQLCAFTGHSIVSHLREVHNLSAGQYRNKVGAAAIASPLAMEMLRKIPKNPFKAEPDYDVMVPAGEFSEAPIALMNWKKAMPFKFSDKLNLMIPKINQAFRFSDNASLIARALVTGKNCYVSGPTGTGKTEEILQVMARLEVPLQRANMHGEVTYGSFVGSMQANAAGTFFQEGMLPLAMKGGYPVLVDEADFTPPSISAVMYPVLERGRSIYIPETGETVVAQPGFTVFGTANTGGKGDLDGKYTGTEVLNTAFLDRFPIKLTANYMEEAKEVALVRGLFPDAEGRFVVALIKTATETRNAFLQGEIVATFSTRKVLEFMEFARDLGTEKAFEITLLNWLDKNDLNVVTAFANKTGLSTLGYKG